MTVAQKFNEGYDQEKCFACSYIEEDNGNVLGNANCPDAPTEDMSVSCPAWATSGCYIGAAVHNVVSKIFSSPITRLGN